MSSRTILLSVALGFVGLAGCNDATTSTDAAVDAPVVDVPVVDAPAADSPAVDAPIADAPTADVSTDAATDVTTDAATDVAPTDAPAADVPVAAFSAMTTLTTINQNCMPVVAADPLTVAGTIALNNTGSLPIGPITLTAGLVVRLLGGDTMATFGVTSVTLPVVAPHTTGTVAFTKAAGTLAGAGDAGVTGCQIVPCGSPIRIVLPLAGPNVPDGARAASEPMTLPCTN